MAKWRVTVDFTDVDGDEEHEVVEVEANTESLAVQMAEDKVDAMHDVESFDGVEAVEA